MIMSIASTFVFSAFILLINRGGYPPRLDSPGKPVREFVEVGIIVAGLLIVPWLNFRLFWYSGWVSAYLVFGILSPLLMELIVRRRGLSPIGFRWPTNRRALLLVVGIIGLYIISKFIYPLIIGAPSIFDWKRFITNSIIFAFLEEAIFRGLIQTRLESALGAVWSWILSGSFFGFYHYYHDYLVTGKLVSIENVFQLVYLTAFGMLLGVIFAKTKSLLPTYLVHALNNLALFKM